MMPIEVLQNLAQKAADALCDLPRYQSPATPAPSIVAHRGAWNEQIGENSLAAFKRASDAGCWAIEFDIHFTSDGVAVVTHDPDLRRCHAHAGVVCDMTLPELQRAAPNVPTAEQVLALRNLHFMIEVKTPLEPQHARTLENLLSRFTPVRDFHLLALDPKLVRTSVALPPEAWILVGEFNLPKLTQVAVEKGLGGVAGHYLLMTKTLIEELHSHGMKAGSGFSPTKNLYNREWNRGVDWVFTNHATRLCEPKLRSTSP